MAIGKNLIWKKNIGVDDGCDFKIEKGRKKALCSLFVSKVPVK